MTTVLDDDVLEERALKHPCGFCQTAKTTGSHERCMRTIRNGKVNNADRLTTCGCTQPGCPAQQPRCMDCRNERAEEINPYTMLCDDRDSCKITVATRRSADPLMQHITRIKEKVMADNATKESTPRKAAAPKVGKCLVTGKPTKGGNFLPGMDARYVSLLVGDVTEGKSTKKQAEDKIKADLGDKHANLLAKFQKSLGLANDRAEKAKKDAKAKEEAKKAAAKEKAKADKASK